MVQPLAKPQTLSGFPSSLPVPRSVHDPSQGHTTFSCLLCPLWSGAASQTLLTSHDLDRFEQFWLWIRQSVSPIGFVWCFLMMRCYGSGAGCPGELLSWRDRRGASVASQLHTLQTDVPVGPQPHFRVSCSSFGNVHEDSDTEVPSPCLW